MIFIVGPVCSHYGFFDHILLKEIFFPLQYSQFFCWLFGSIETRIFFFSEYEFPGFMIYCLLWPWQHPYTIWGQVQKGFFIEAVSMLKMKTMLPKSCFVWSWLLRKCIFVLLISEMGRLLWSDSFSIYLQYAGGFNFCVMDILS